MISSRKRSNSKSKKEISLSWDNYIDMVNKLSEKIEESGVKIDYVYGVPRGGLIPGVLISHNLKKKYINALDFQTYFNIIRKKETVLVIDDIADTGQTLKNFSSHTVLKCVTATLYKHKKSRYTPDFYIDENSSWVKFPYERD